ncbi:MAG: HAMP domain-containing histidine kinase [Acidobacteria bacterium]|nr:HAMP domain-containing histidine kinase [Acidobacteriota bacterium]
MQSGHQGTGAVWPSASAGVTVEAPADKGDFVSEDQKLPSRDVLIALNRSVTAARLLSGAVHEVNNALQVISGTVEILQGRTDLGDPVTRALERVRAQSARAANALADVLVFTKGAVDESARIDLRQTIAYCLGVRSFAVHRAGLSSRFESNPDEAYVTTGSRPLVQQAILNLIVNAEEASADTRGTISVELRREGPWNEVRVTDEGRGVALEPRERAFEPFVSTRDAWQGAGLGLWAARAIAEAHGGTLTVEDSAQGATFVLRLPTAVDS